MASVRPILRWFVTSASLLLFVATAALWVRSYCAGERYDLVTQPLPPPTGWQAYFARARYDRTLTVGSWDGQLSLQFGDAERQASAYYRSATTLSPGAPGDLDDDVRRQVAGDIHYRGTDEHPSVCRFGIAYDARSPFTLLFGRRVVFLRFWLPTLVLALLPLRAARRRWNRKILPGHCTVCSYDLRATPDRCPERGTVPRRKRWAR